MDIYLLLVVWALSGAIAWWLIVRYIHKQLDPSNLVILPFMIVLGAGSIFVVLIDLILSLPDKPLKSWKDKE
jgi:hypothetical protein